MGINSNIGKIFHLIFVFLFSELRHYSWTGENQFFVHGQKDCLSIGAGHGHNGLWVDADLNHGRSQRYGTIRGEDMVPMGYGI